VKQIADQMSSLGKGDVKVPTDTPKEPAFLGGSVTAGPKGFQFRLVVPSAVGPVIEKGLVPVIQSQIP
jgi:hypothetical protein